MSKAIKCVLDGTAAFTKQAFTVQDYLVSLNQIAIADVNKSQIVQNQSFMNILITECVDKVERAPPHLPLLPSLSLTLLFPFLYLSSKCRSVDNGDVALKALQMLLELSFRQEAIDYIKNYPNIETLFKQLGQQHPICQPVIADLTFRLKQEKQSSRPATAKPAPVEGTNKTVFISYCWDNADFMRTHPTQQNKNTLQEISKPYHPQK